MLFLPTGSAMNFSSTGSTNSIAIIPHRLHRHHAGDVNIGRGCDEGDRIDATWAGATTSRQGIDVSRHNQEGREPAADRDR